jgi:hypothetical protein
MKNIVLVALLSLGFTTGNAQKLSIGLNGGMALFLYTNTGPTASFQYGQENGYYGSGRVSLFLLKWQIGAAFDMHQVAVRSRNFGNDIQTKFNSMVPTVFINKIFSLPKSYIYAGLNGGMNFGTADNKSTISGVTATTSNEYSGYVGGVQVGYTIRLIGGLAANAEAGARYMNMKYKVTAGAAPVVQHVVIPVSLGLNYIF